MPHGRPASFRRNNDRFYGCILADAREREKAEAAEKKRKEAKEKDEG